MSWNPFAGSERSRANDQVVFPAFETLLRSVSPEALAAFTFALGAASTVSATFVYRRFLRRIPNSDYVTPNILAKKRWVKGTVVSVGDADNFRLYHTPGLGWRWPLKFRRIPSVNKELKDQTIHIRIAGVDAPEGAYFGRPSQPYYEESLAWLKNQIDGRTVYCQLVRKDQYSRIVAVPYLKPRLLPGFMAKGKCLPIEMLRAGWVVTYEQAGAEYGKWSKDEFLRLQAEAQAAKKGMWKYGMSGETPAEYKRRYAGSADAAETGKTTAAKKNAQVQTGWLTGLWRKLAGTKL